MTLFQSTTSLAYPSVIRKDSLTSLLPPSASCFLISYLHSSSAGGSFQTKLEHILSFLKTLQWLSISIKFKFLMWSTKPCMILPLAAVLMSCPTTQDLTNPFWPLFPKNAKPSQDFGTYCPLSDTLFPSLNMHMAYSLMLFRSLLKYHLLRAFPEHH